MKSLSEEQNWALHIAAGVATAGALLLAYKAGTRRGALARDHKKVFVLAVSLSFKDAKEKDRWMTAWKPMVEQVKANEPGTISYELCIGDTEPLKALVYERYVDKAAYEQVHRTSEAMAKFKANTAGVKVTVTGTSYYETNIGFM